MDNYRFRWKHIDFSLRIQVFENKKSLVCIMNSTRITDFSRKILP